MGFKYYELEYIKHYIADRTNNIDSDCIDIRSSDKVIRINIVIKDIKIKNHGINVIIGIDTKRENYSGIEELADLILNRIYKNVLGLLFDYDY